MTTKDWKKEVWGYMNKLDNNYQITLVKRFKWKNGFLTNERNGIGVIINKGLKNVIFNKTFKTRTLALKFVKSYIRKN